MVEDQAVKSSRQVIENTDSPSQTGCTESQLYANAQNVDPDGTPTYVCQATRLPYATTALSWWEYGQYLEDFLSGNVSLWRICQGSLYSMYFNLSNAGIGIGAGMRWLYEGLSWLWRGSLWPRRMGSIPRGGPTPTKALNLQPGEFVRVKSHKEILLTLDSEGKNRGMGWDAELVPYCGGTFRVLDRVNRIINERTGKMMEMKTPCIILDSVYCESRYSECRMFCPRSIYS